MNEKRFIVFPNNVVWDNQLDEVVCRCILEGIGDAENVCQRLNEQQARIKELEEENEQFKYINNQIDEELIDEEMTNMECLLLLIPFVILFVLLAMIIIAFLVQLGWVVI